MIGCHRWYHAFGTVSVSTRAVIQVGAPAVVRAGTVRAGKAHYPSLLSSRYGRGARVFCKPPSSPARFDSLTAEQNR